MSRRYLSVKIVDTAGITDGQFRETLEKAVKTCFGELGFSRIDPKLIRYDSASSVAIVSCQQRAVAELETALFLTTECAGHEIAALVLGVSGTIRGIRRALK